MKIVFFLSMKSPPTVTHQEKKVGISEGKPYFYEPEDLKATRAKLIGLLGKHKPGQKLKGPIRLTTKWIWPRGKHAEGEYKITKPDTDNMIKLLKDCMTAVGFWNDDAQVASEITEKFYGDTTGIYIRVERL